MWSRPFTISRDHLLPFLSFCLLIIQLGLSISDLPAIKLIQDIICKDVHRVDNPAPLPEEDCRDEAVQHRLNYIIIGMQISATISGTKSHTYVFISTSSKDLILILVQQLWLPFL